MQYSALPPHYSAFTAWNALGVGVNLVDKSGIPLELYAHLQRRFLKAHV